MFKCKWIEPSETSGLTFELHHTQQVIRD
jgi:hypothetical protein